MQREVGSYWGEMKNESTKEWKIQFPFGIMTMKTKKQAKEIAEKTFPDTAKELEVPNGK